MRNEIVKAINKLCEELDSAYYINAGGCCYCASLIARELEVRKIKSKWRFFLALNSIGR